MALKKELMLPGVKLRVRSLKSKTAGINFGNNDSLPGLRIQTQIGNSGRADIGDVLEVVKKPRNLGAAGNCCRVRSVNGLEGEVWWTELRSNCEIVEQE